jgi:hypothetical protein
MTHQQQHRKEPMSISKTTHVCSRCKGVVRNIDGKRHSNTKLTDIHDKTCPGRRRGVTTEEES